ncbi:VirC1 protein [Pseudovibrio sp. Ad13]|uniref:ParA family protein n=1 Tax=Pseudovibrio sp. Ad13 TaxID=989396 RepID=UPI0007AED7CC|nr:ParA family protein [Pseudovibrio sp. Ad13]KZK82122.1 VirC1 protein [Pseudovibrio sp. Ad13]
MAHTISAIQQKGGCGKSTLIISLASILAGEGHNIIIPDTDTLRSSSLWAEQEVLDRGNIDFLCETNDNAITGLLQELKGEYDYTLVDTAGFNSRIAAYIAAASDLVLIPCSTTVADIEGAVNTQRFLSKLSAETGKPITSAVVRTDFDRNTRNVDDITNELSDESALDVLDTILWHTTTFKTAMNTGDSIKGRAKVYTQELVGELRAKRLIPPAIIRKVAA